MANVTIICQYFACISRAGRAVERLLRLIDRAERPPLEVNNKSKRTNRHVIWLPVFLFRFPDNGDRFFFLFLFLPSGTERQDSRILESGGISLRNSRDWYHGEREKERGRERERERESSQICRERTNKFACHNRASTWSSCARTNGALIRRV